MVTGDSSGNDRILARAFVGHGAAAVVAGVREELREGGAPTHELLQQESRSRLVCVGCAVSKVADLEAAIEAAEELGGLDVVKAGR